MTTDGGARSNIARLSTSILRRTRLVRFRNPQSGASHYQEVIRRLDALSEAQIKIAHALADARAEVSRAVTSISIEQNRMRPPKSAWVVAGLIFAASMGIISLATSGIVHISLINGQTGTLYEQAQADRAQAVEQIVGILGPFDQSIVLKARTKQRASELSLTADKALVATSASADDLLQNANEIDKQAGSIDASTAFELYFIEVILVIGSCVAGGVISWALTQFLINRHRPQARHT